MTADSGTYVGEDYVLDWKCVSSESVKDKIKLPEVVPPGTEVVYSMKSSINALRITDVVGMLKRMALEYGVEIDINRETHWLWQNVYFTAKSTQEYRLQAFHSGLNAWEHEFNEMLKGKG